MNQALQVFWYIFQKFNNLIFNDFEISSNVTIGWIIVSAIIMLMITKTLLNIPSSKAEGDYNMTRRLYMNRRNRYRA